MKWRITAPCAINETFTLVSVQIEDPATGEPVDKRVMREQYSCLVDTGSVVDIGDHIIPGPYMDAVDEAGEAMIQKYIHHARPDFHNTVENLSLSAVPGPALGEQRSWAGDREGRPQASDVPVHAPAVLQALQAQKVAPKLPSLGRK